MSASEDIRENLVFPTFWGTVMTCGAKTECSLHKKISIIPKRGGGAPCTVLTVLARMESPLVIGVIMLLLINNFSPRCH